MFRLDRIVLSFALILLSAPAFADTATELTALQSMVKSNAPRHVVLAKIAAIRRSLIMASEPGSKANILPPIEGELKPVNYYFSLNESTCEAPNNNVGPGTVVEVLSEPGYVPGSSVAMSMVRVISTTTGRGVAPVGCEGYAYPSFLGND